MHAALILGVRVVSEKVDADHTSCQRIIGKWGLLLLVSLSLLFVWPCGEAVDELHSQPLVSLPVEEANPGGLPLLLRYLSCLVRSGVA